MYAVLILVNHLEIVLFYSNFATKLHLLYIYVSKKKEKKQ